MIPLIAAGRIVRWLSPLLVVAALAGASHARAAASPTPRDAVLTPAGGRATPLPNHRAPFDEPRR